MICDICGNKNGRYNKKYNLVMCPDCVDATEYEDYKFEVNNTLKEMTI